MTEWMPRGMCGPWTFWVQWLYILANVVIGLAYYVIPFKIWLVYRREQRIGLDAGIKFILIGFAVFIFACGTMHIVENIGAFFWPQYEVYTFGHLFTATASVLVAIVLPVREISQAIDDANLKRIRAMANQAEEDSKALEGLRGGK